jgi:hypothetical protein
MAVTSSERRGRIEVMRAFVKALFDREETLELGPFLDQVVNKYVVSRRTAKEYLDVALIGIKYGETCGFIYSRD